MIFGGVRPPEVDCHPRERGQSPAGHGVQLAGLIRPLAPFQQRERAIPQSTGPSEQRQRGLLEVEMRDSPYVGVHLINGQLTCVAGLREGQEPGGLVGGVHQRLPQTGCVLRRRALDLYCG